MKAVAPHAGISQLARQREGLRHLRLAPVECGVEARHLRDVRRRIQDGADRCQIVGLVQRCQRNQLGERRQHGSIQAHGRRVMEATVHDAMADSLDRRIIQQARAGGQQLARRRVVIEALCRPVALSYGPSPRIADRQLWRDAKAFDLPAEHHGHAAVGVIQRKFHTGGAGIDDRYAACHGALTLQATMLAPPST